MTEEEYREATDKYDYFIKDNMHMSKQILPGNNFDIKEPFVGFYETTSTTGENLCKILLQAITENHLSILDCRGQAYDGASNMSGEASSLLHFTIQYN